jgi:hypothetical protein
LRGLAGFSAGICDLRIVGLPAVPDHANGEQYCAIMPEGEGDRLGKSPREELRKEPGKDLRNRKGLLQSKVSRQTGA